MYLSFHLMVFETEVYFGLVVIYNILFAEGGGGHTFIFIKTASVRL